MYTWIDYLIIAIFVLSMLAGLRRGFIREAISLATLIAAFVVAITFSKSFAGWLGGFPAAQSVINALANVFGEANAADALSLITLGLSFFILFLLTMIAGSIIGNLASGLSAIPGLGMIDRLLGVVFGAVKGFLWCVVILFLLNLTSVPQGDAWAQSQLRPHFDNAVSWLSNTIQPGLQMVKDKLGNAIGNSGGSGIYH